MKRGIVIGLVIAVALFLALGAWANHRHVSCPYTGTPRGATIDQREYDWAAYTFGKRVADHCWNH